MTLIVKCVICEKQIENPIFEQVTCKRKECQDKYQRYLVWHKRERDKKKKEKDYKVVKIIKTKREQTK